MKIPKRIASAVINSLKSGVVPRVGLAYVTVGRDTEIAALIHDIDIVDEGGASFRFISGKYGSGKSFLLQTMRNYAMDRNFVVADADLSPERRLQGNKGQGLATYKELIRNISTKTRPEGGALNLILDRWLSNIRSETAADCEFEPNSPAFQKEVEKRIYHVVDSLQEMVHGFDFARLLTLYFRAYLQEDDEMKAKIIRWFRGEYSTKTEAKNELGISIIISDDDWYEYMKIFATFFKKAGYHGLILFIDELVNLYKIPQSITRQYNYEKILTMYNDVLQGKAQNLGIIMCGTPQCIEDPRRGLFSYEALRTRLSEGRFSQDGFQDMLAPVIKLKPLTKEELLILTEKLTDIHAQLFDYPKRLTEDDLAAFIKTEFSRIGADSLITPREITRDFIEFLNILYQDPKINPQKLLASEDFQFSSSDNEDEEDLFAEFEI